MDRVRLLIVEDDALIARDLQQLLTDLGYAVLATCTNAADARTALAAHRPDLALLDIRLGAGEDGVDLAAHIHATYALPFVFITAHADAGTIARVKPLRPAGFIIKPFDADELRAQIELALARHAAHVEAPAPPPAAHQGFRIGEVLFVRDKGRLVKVPVDAIVYVEADDNYAVLHTADRRYAMPTSLTALEERLAAHHLVRIHRRYLVDLRRITALREREAQLGDLSLPIGRTHREELRRRWEGR